MSPLARVDAARVALAAAEAELLDAVREARAARVSWAAIGGVFGVTRQAAWERFSGRLGS